MAFWEVINLYILFNLMSFCYGTPSFSQTPEKKSALTGGDVTFYCTVDGLEDRHVVQWKRGGSTITNNSDILIPNTDKIRVIADPSMGLYNLQISNVRQSDDLNYVCVVYDLEEETEVLSSDPARLEVHTVPDPKYPDCDPLEEPKYEEGDELTILCKSERANPPVLLQWYQGGENIEDAVLDDEQAGFRTLSYTFTVKYKDDGAIFQCKMTTSAIDSFERSCSLGPLRIEYKPRIQLALPEEPIHDGTQIRLVCNDDAKPRAFGYEWFSSIPIPDDQMTLIHNRREMLLTVSVSLNETKISCNATNIHGAGRSNSVTLFVQPKQITPTEGTGKGDETRLLTTTKDINNVPPGGPGMGSVSSAEPGLSSRLLLLIIGILSIMLIVLLLVLIFYTCRTYQTNGNHSIIYGAPSSICNGTNIDRAWDQTSVYFEPRDQISVHEAPTWVRTPKPPQWRRNVAVQVPFQEDPPYAEIEQDWDDGVYTLQI